jgi:hypothetical protein
MYDVESFYWDVWVLWDVVSKNYKTEPNGHINSNNSFSKGFGIIKIEKRYFPGWPMYGSDIKQINCLPAGLDRGALTASPAAVTHDRIKLRPGWG